MTKELFPGELHHLDAGVVYTGEIIPKLRGSRETAPYVLVSLEIVLQGINLLGGRHASILKHTGTHRSA